MITESGKSTLNYNNLVKLTLNYDNRDISTLNYDNLRYGNQL